MLLKYFSKSHTGVKSAVVFKWSNSSAGSRDFVGTGIAISSAGLVHWSPGKPRLISRTGCRPTGYRIIDLIEKSKSDVIEIIWGNIKSRTTDFRLSKN